ncbi:probable G-protein coupled receptor 171 isoform X1 [Alosa sapidissima]|uniref:probable G-protein coupled receptor 171 isoform X1 n=2 Tax=Alosa sapidissima TaxID=34773 RepID=UPI001C08671D|nr:probable G-protein coupled receptor 171 isoform X1 [Alosa sapidissima]XP_041919226.1 probable G-protein coupled receptor 171 isoform X1 [Alosa sapidissima]
MHEGETRDLHETVHHFLTCSCDVSAERPSDVLDTNVCLSYSSSLHQSAMASSSNSSCVVNDNMEPFAAMYIVIFLVGMAGSLVSLWAFIRGRATKKCMSVYLINLLTSDFLLMLALPFKIAKDLGVDSVPFSVFQCQCSSVLIYINMYASITFLAFVSMNRYLQITQSSRLLHLQEPCFAGVMSAVVWLLVLFINVPNMAIPIEEKLPEAPFGCADLKTQLGKHWHLLSVFLGMAIFLNASAALFLSNGLVLKQLWGRRHAEPAERASVRQATVSIATVTGAYVLCFVPYHAVRMPYTFTQTNFIEDCELHRSLFLAKESTLLLAILHLCFDPVLYFYLSSSVRLKVTGVLSSMRSRAGDKEMAPAPELEQKLEP